MERPPHSIPSSVIPAVALLALFATVPVAAQQSTEPVASPLVEAAGAMFVTLLVGGGLIVFAPEYTDRTTLRILDRPVEAFLYGLLIGIAAAIVLVVLILTLIGIVVAIPLLIVMIVLAELGYLAAGRTVAESWGIVLLMAIVLAAFAGGVPLLGWVVGFVLSSLGLGGAVLEYQADDPPGGRSERHAGEPRSPGAGTTAYSRD